MSDFFASPAAVIRGLVTYVDVWQPPSASIIEVGAARRSSSFGDGTSTALLERLDERTELRNRMQVLEERDRHLLYLWYVAQLPASEIARTLGISRRQCFRRRASAIRRLVEREEGAG